MDPRNDPNDDVLDVMVLIEDPDAAIKSAALCPECMIPLDEREPDDAHCPWCGARIPEPLQALTWAELEAIEQAWPEALGA